MENLGIKDSRNTNADANISTLPAREKSMSLEKLANTFRKLVTTAGTTFDTGLSSLSQDARISAITKATGVGKSGDDYHATISRNGDSNPNSHSAGREDAHDNADQYDNRNGLAPRHEDVRGSDLRDTRDAGTNENHDDRTNKNASSNEHPPHDKDNSNNPSQSDTTNQQSTSKSDNGDANGNNQQDSDSNPALQGKENSSATAQQLATAGANAGINVGNSILGTSAKGEIGKSNGTTQAGLNAKLNDVGPVTKNNGTTNQGSQVNTHMGPKTNTANANANQNILSSSQSEANVQANNTAEQQAQKIAKSLNSNDKVKVNVNVDTSSGALISKPNSNLIAGTVLAGTDGKSTNQTGQQNAPGQAANGQAPSVAAVAQQVLAAQAQNQGQQNNNQNSQARTQSSGVSNLASSSQATQVNGTALSSGGETTASVAGTTTNNSPQITQTTQQAQDAQVNQKPILKSSVIDQISVKISKALQAGNDKISVQLKPAELGRVDVKMELTHDGRVMAIVTADNKDTLDLLRKDSNDLQKALENAGLKMDSGDMTFNLRGEENAMANNGNQNAANSVDDETTNADLDNLILAQDIDIISDTRIDVRA